ERLEGDDRRRPRRIDARRSGRPHRREWQAGVERRAPEDLELAAACDDDSAARDDRAADGRGTGEAGSCADDGRGDERDDKQAASAAHGQPASAALAPERPVARRRARRSRRAEVVRVVSLQLQTATAWRRQFLVQNGACASAAPSFPSSSTTRRHFRYARSWRRWCGAWGGCVTAWPAARP